MYECMIECLCRTHQLRQSRQIPVTDVASFRADSQMRRVSREEERSEEAKQNLHFAFLHKIRTHESVHRSEQLYSASNIKSPTLLGRS